MLTKSCAIKVRMQHTLFVQINMSGFQSEHSDYSAMFAEYLLSYIIPRIRFSSPITVNKEVCLWMQALFCQMSSTPSDTDTSPLRFCLFPEMIMISVTVHCELLWGSGAYRHLPLNGGYFSGDESPFICQPFLSPASSFPLDFPLSAYLSNNQWHLFVSFPKSRA